MIHSTEFAFESRRICASKSKKKTKNEKQETLFKNCNRNCWWNWAPRANILHDVFLHSFGWVLQIWKLVSAISRYMHAFCRLKPFNEIDSNSVCACFFHNLICGTSHPSAIQSISGYKLNFSSFWLEFYKNNTRNQLAKRGSTHWLQWVG